MMQETAIHSETQVFPFKTPVVLAVFLSCALIPVFLSLPWWMAIGIVLVGVLAAALVHSVMTLRVEVTPTTLEFGYWFSAPKIPLPEIADLQIVEIPKLAGIGMHIYKFYYVYNARFGRGIQFSTPKRKYMVGSDNPEHLLSILITAIPRKR
ncbi:hypothetical protein KKH18_01100 [bacterium]|nr:hypothetical protein [bacterium]